ncbi:hypothetical protein BT69DRAFT_819922 [Atractiella rhizophila]|nr:hypothetical protein BT69DRAFT_819922 [Atractiella rhizophila]
MSSNPNDNLQCFRAKKRAKIQGRSKIVVASCSKCFLTAAHSPLEHANSASCLSKQSGICLVTFHLTVRTCAYFIFLHCFKMKSNNKNNNRHLQLIHYSLTSQSCSIGSCLRL